LETKNDLEYRLGDPEEEDNQNELLEKKNKNKNKIIIFAIIISIVIFAGIIVIIFVSKKKKSDDDYYIYKNISITKNKIILNSFKLNGENYNPKVGNMNNGNDYEENDRTNFDICIPYNITKRKNKNNRIFLYIHGGGWISETKSKHRSKM